ncbi:hypothetical protein BU16DRAFT_326403 [Lophium mytilinum]|uniref:Uncharacterized protein n=1 Tax=Lophium mytilinum TaxID=390894 RepID=A0A6A6R0E6_9PEZI|nr:hypothetical protein BU16DRAFT_326403 [Lophium mytilinum]
MQNGSRLLLAWVFLLWFSLLYFFPSQVFDRHDQGQFPRNLIGSASYLAMKVWRHETMTTVGAGCARPISLKTRR